MDTKDRLENVLVTGIKGMLLAVLDFCQEEIVKYLPDREDLATEIKQIRDAVAEAQTLVSIEYQTERAKSFAVMVEKLVAG